MDWKVRAFTLILWLGLVLASIQHGNGEKRVVCYYTNWSVYRPGTAKFSPQNINPYLCTHLIYAFGGFTKENTLKPFDKYQDIEKGGYAKFTGLKTYNKNLKTLLAIGGWNEGSSRFSPMVADARRRKEFVKNCVKFLRQNHFDGLDLDWEYPAFRDGGQPHDKENYALLVEELREQFERESSKTGRTRLLLTMAMPAGIEYIDKGYDVPRLNENLDFINLLSYDYHSAFEPAVNHHSPLYSLEEDNEYNYDTELTIDYTISHLIKKGASPEKIVLGIPAYGRSYTLFNEDSTEIGSPAAGPGIEGDATREKGYLAYYEICENIQKGDWEVIQPNPEAMGPYAFKENQWVGYDDENIIRLKAQYVNEKNLGGIMFWSIENDDFRGKCHGRPYPLIEAAKEALFFGSPKPQEVKEKTTIKKPSRTQSSQSNTSGRPYSSANRRTSTTESTTRKRLGSSKSKNKFNARVSEDKEDEEEIVHLEVEEEEENNDRNAVRTNDKPTRSRFNSKNRPRSRATEDSGRKKQKNRDNKPVEDSNVEESFSNKFTTPEPPTTPDPGADFKCQDEGFFSHPRDCKKYFWCLDSGPSGLGIVGHQFTCPSGLVFNKAADSCDYPRNVICPKVKSESEVKTTRAPTLATTAQSTTTRRTTTEKPEPEEEYEYEEEDDVEEEEEAPKTTAKPLIYKTISRNRPSSTTPSTATTTKAYQETFEKSTELTEEEDPRVIKELLDLIKKAGGIEHLEKQLLLQEKHTGGTSGTTAERGQATPATISRTLYERVLNRQGSKVGSRVFGTSSPKSIEHKGKEEKEENNKSRIGYTNGPGQAQFDGLDDLPEVKSLRRTNKPKYTTIERSSSSKPSPSDRIDDSEDEEETDDNTDVASSEEKRISNPPDDKTLLPRVTPSYVNIRRNHQATTSKDENDVNVKGEVEEDKPGTRHRFSFTTRTEKTFSEKEDPKPQRSSSIADLPDEVQSPTESEKSVTRTIFPNRNTDESSNSKSRYVSIQRFRSTTEKPESNQSEDQETTSTPRVTIQTETTLSTSRKDTSTPAPGSSEIPYTVSMSYSQSSLSSSLSTSPLTTITTSTTTTENPTTLQNTFDDEPVFRTEITNPTRSSYLGVKLVEDSESETFLSTLPFSSSPTTATESTTKVNLAAVSQPRPFGFTRSRSRPSLTQTSSFLDSTTALSTSTTVPSRSKVSTSSRNFTRSANTQQTRGRVRQKATTESSSRVLSEKKQKLRESVGTQEVTEVSKPISRRRGSTRYSRPTASADREEISSNSISRTRVRVTTISPNAETIQPSRRSRRPISKSNIERESRNELENSPIIRISQEVPQNNSSTRRSRRPGKNIGEGSLIKNIRVFKEPENIESQRPGLRRFEDSTAQASIQDLSETTSTSNLDKETFFSPSSYNFSETTKSYLKSTREKDNQISWTGRNSIHPYYSTDLGVNIPSTTTEPVKSRNYRRKFTASYDELSRSVSSTESSTNPRKRILLLRKRPVTDTSTEANENETFRTQRRRKVIRRLRPTEKERSTTTESYRNQEQKEFRTRYFTRSTTPKTTADKLHKLKTTVNPSNFNEDSIYGTYTTEIIPTDADTTTFSSELNDDSTENVQTTLLDQITEAEVTNPVTEDYFNYESKATTEWNTIQTSTLPTTLIIVPDHLPTLTEFLKSRTSSPTEISSTYETTTPIALKITQSNEPFITRQKLSRRPSKPTTRTANARRFPTYSTSSISSTTEFEPEVVAKRLKNLFIRRRPSFSRAFLEPENNNFDETEDIHDVIEDVTLGNTKNNETSDNSSFAGVPDEFWKSFTTAINSQSKSSLQESTKGPNVLFHLTESSSTESYSDNNEKVRPVYQRPEYRTILRTSSKTLAPDSSPKEFEDGSNIPSNTARSTLSVYRKPRLRLQNNEPNVENSEGLAQIKNRFFPKRKSTTEQSVMETLVPAKKFDYTADAYLRKQQSQRGSSKSRNKDEEDVEFQNSVDIYSTTPSSKPQITRLVTSVVESATTERQRILIRRKYSQLTSTSFIPVQTTTSRYERPIATSFFLKSNKRNKENLNSKDEYLNEIPSSASTEPSIEKSTLPIESAFLKGVGRFTTEATGESSTIEIESMASFLLPTLKQLIGHPSYSSFNLQEDNIVGVTQPSVPSSKENSLRRSFDEKPDLVDDPIQILDDTDEDTNELLKLRVPENKLNKTIHTVLKIQVLDSSNEKKDNSLELDENIVNRNLVTNELLSTKQSEVLSEAQKISITESTPSDESNATVIPSTTSSLPLNPRTADIERARRRRTRTNSSQATTRSIHNKPRVQTRRSYRRSRISAPRTTTTIRVTTSRGSTLPPPSTTDFIRGFLLTRNIDEVLITKKFDQVSTAGIQQSTDLSTVSTTEVTSAYSTKATESLLDTTTEYSESSTFINSRFNGNRNQEEESVSNFYETTTEIAQKNEEVNYADTFSPGDYFYQSLENTTESFGTTISDLEENNDIDFGHTLLNTVIVPDTEKVMPLPQSYLRRKKIKKIKPVSSVEDSTTQSFTYTTEDSSYFTHHDPTTITIMDSTLPDITSPPTTLDLTTFTQTSDLTTLDFTSESLISTTETPLIEQSTISDDLVASGRTGFNFTDISDYSIKLITQFKNIFLKNDDFIKPTSKSVESNTDRTDSFTTILTLEDFQTTSYEPDDLEKLESKGAIEIKDKDITTEKGLKADSTTPSSKHQIRDENDTATSFTKSSTVITNQSLLVEAKANSPSLTTTTVESVAKNKKTTANGRKRVLKRKRQKIEPTLHNKNMKVSKTEAIEVTLEKNEEKSTTPATVISTKTTPETEKPTRKRIVVNRGTVKFASGTTPSSMAVESLPNIRDHPNQIASRRKNKVVRKRPKLPTTDIPESNLSTLNNQSDSNGKQLSLDPEIKTYNDADEAGSEVNVYRSSAFNTRRPASFHQREPYRSRVRTSTYQPLTSTQAASRRFGSLSALRQTLLSEETTLPSKKFSLASEDDSAILLKQLTKQQDQRAEMDDQTNRAHEIMLEPETNLSTTEPGDSSFRRPFWRKISTTETPRTLGTTAIPAFRRRQGQKYFNRVVSQNLSQNLPQKPRRPAIVDYDYYEDEEERFVGKPSLNGKLYVTSRGSIRCLEQGNFPHPSSCKKFITCARMVNGLIVGTEYMCPDKLSFDPIGGICNWSAGLGCKE